MEYVDKSLSSGRWECGRNCPVLSGRLSSRNEAVVVGEGMGDGRVDAVQCVSSKQKLWEGGDNVSTIELLVPGVYQVEMRNEPQVRKQPWRTSCTHSGV